MTRNKNIIITLLLFIYAGGYGQYENPLKRLYFVNERKDISTVSFELINNLIIIPVTINNSDTLRFILDTGLSTTMITDLGNEEKVELKVAREIELKGLGEGQPLSAYHTYGNVIQVAGIEGRNQDIYLIKDNVFKLSSRMGKRIHGILGYSVFKDFVVEINYSRKRISFIRPEAFRYKWRHRNFETTEMKVIDKKPYLQISLTDENGEKHIVTLLLDTGASHSMWIDRKSTNIPLPDETRHMFLGTGLNGDVYGKIGRMNNMNILGFEIENPIVSFPEESSVSHAMGMEYRNGSMGSEVLKRFNIIFDYNNEQIALKPNGYFKEAFAQNLSGLKIIAPFPEIPAYQVESVRKDSPAERAGLKKGDIIEMINNVKAEKYTLNDIYHILQYKPGLKITISYMRNGERKTAQFKLESYI